MISTEKNKTKLSEKLIPLSLCLVLYILDQVTKSLIVKYVPPYTVGASFFGDFFRIIHVYNPGIAFSIGDSLSSSLRSILFCIAPLAVLILVLIVYFRNKDFTYYQRWLIAGIVGGGFGNLTDRFFRSEGVVDFIDVKFFGIFGLERWPTFNVADMSVLICGILLLISFLLTIKKESSKNTSGEKNDK